MYKRILIATDGSALSRKALTAAIGMAVIHEASLIVLKVVPRYPVSYFEGSVTIEPHDVARIEKSWNDAAQTVVDAAVASAAKQGISAKGVLARSDLVAESVIAMAGKHKADLIVMASHGRRGLKRLLLGSETLNVLTHSTVPVLVLR